MNLKLKRGRTEEQRADLLVQFRFNDHPLAPDESLGKVASAAISRWLKKSAFGGNVGAMVHFPLPPGSAQEAVLVLGAGHGGATHPASLYKAACIAGRRLAKANPRSVVVQIPTTWPQDQAVRLIASGLIAGAYEFHAFSAPTKSLERSNVTLAIDPSHAATATLRASLHEGFVVGGTLNRIRDLANLPGNIAPPAMIADYARKMARTLGLRCKVYDEKALLREKCGALLAVGRGSRQPPRLVVLEHRGARADSRPIVLVGKTITFDTGGISIKPSKNMEWMKYDKSGGMAVLAVMAAAAQLRLPRRIIGILAAAENMPGGEATRPGDIVRARNGKTIEILNTDAEGRLVLADALSIAQDFRPAAIVDLATLTGAAVTAVGRVVSAVMSNDQKTMDALIAAGHRTGERLWPLPLYPEYRELITTPFADLRNIGDGSAGTIVGGMFLREFVSPTTPWVHIDLTHAWEERDQNHMAAGANLFGTRLLLDWLARSTP